MFIQCCFHKYTLLSCTSFNTHLHMCMWLVLYILIPCVLIWPPPGLRQSWSITTEVMKDLMIALSPVLHKVFQDFYPIQLVMVSCSNSIEKERRKETHILLCVNYIFHLNKSLKLFIEILLVWVSTVSALEPGIWVWIPASPHVNSQSLGKSLNLFVNVVPPVNQGQ